MAGWHIGFPQTTRKGRRLTPREEYNVSAIEPKYAAVNGNREPEKRCWTGSNADQYPISLRPTQAHWLLTICDGPHHHCPGGQEEDGSHCPPEGIAVVSLTVHRQVTIGTGKREGC